MYNNTLFRFDTYQKILDKFLVTLIAIFALTFFFPKKKIFKYEFSKGKPWIYEDLFSPFNFFVFKNKKEIDLEIKNVKKEKNFFYYKNTKVVKEIKKKLIKKKLVSRTRKKIFKIVNTIYRYGYLNTKNFSIQSTKKNIFFSIYKKKYWRYISYKNIYTSDKVNHLIERVIPKNSIHVKEILRKTIVPDLNYEKNYTEKIFNEKIKSIKKIKYSIAKGERIIGKNDVINESKFRILSFFRKEYETRIWNKKKNYYLMIGHFLIISVIFSIFILYLFYFQNKIFQNNREINFLVINILFISFITIFTLNFYSKTLYLIPFCILPISVRAFFNFNLSFFIHLITILLLSLITPNSFEFIFIQITTGFLVMLTKKNIFKMKNLFFTVGKITGTSIVIFCLLTLIREGTLEKISLFTFSLFFFSGLLTLFVHPLIFIFEKLLNLTSDISLLELSDINTPILRLLSKKAPGTLQHVLTVANIAEEAAVSIGANSLLVRIGAIYHDIGKIKNSIFFTENQHNITINPHEYLSPKESAKIILEHVSIGIELAKKYHLPDPITDFIRTHHGNSMVHYFYEKQKKKYPNIWIEKEQFKYSGPKPFSKETAIVMICDSVEAASKSIKNPSDKNLENLVENIINKQKEENQFSNSDITLKEIEKIKQVLKKKLLNIYHTRIEYPMYNNHINKKK
ncbi:HD family phosphohydrolase [Blattabacterium cuenoti]|uniref:HD family phosphohydrolase n=1 Tax=Blattabacterium cuenoti TaxID=1653831 RepID=UPI00163C6792|nr:HDIG domain-containing metalloprotein [Blattabacterium cuenoti]